MRVSKEDLICGVPAPLARKLMRRYWTEGTEVLACDVFGVTETAAWELLRAFEAGGYLERCDIPHPAGRHWWATTVRGNALAQASFAKPVSRATAQRHLGEVVERARRYNADPSFLLSVAEITVFGSFLDPAADRLGDLDLAVTAARREPDAGRYADSALAYARASGRSFATFLDQLGWPARELRMILKNRSPVIRITAEDVSQLTGRFEVVYTVRGDPAAIPLPPGAVIER